MGITGLLPFLKDASTTCHISEFRGCTVVIDAYCWLHKGACGCPEKIYKAEETDIYVNYCLKWLRMLESHNIKPIMVFDGQCLPAKHITEERRRSIRNASRIQAKELMRLGNGKEARLHLTKSIDITHEMALNVIKVCRKRNIDCIVAPYEADAQMTYLNLQGIADLVVTEDSDLVMFGCNKILYKLNISGSGVLVEKDKLIRAMNLRPSLYTFTKFQQMCILSGCDYLDSLPGIGLKRALKAIACFSDSNIDNALRKLPRYLNMYNLKVSNEYIEQFKLAEAALNHQIVYDPLKRSLVHLTSPDCVMEAEYLKNIGELCDPDKAFQMAIGNINPVNSNVLDNWDPDNLEMPATSIWSKSFRKRCIKGSVFTPALTSKSTISKEVTINTNIQSPNEHEKLEYDCKLAEELKTYTSKQDSHKSQSPKLQCSNPVLAEHAENESLDLYKQLELNNPFLICKPLSKFGQTNLESDKVVCSRFFKTNNDDEARKENENEYEKQVTFNEDKSKTMEECIIIDEHIENEEKENNIEEKRTDIEVDDLLYDTLEGLRAQVAEPERYDSLQSHVSVKDNDYKSPERTRKRNCNKKPSVSKVTRKSKKVTGFKAKLLGLTNIDTEFTIIDMLNKMPKKN